jgi:hypothetical protein
VSAIIAAVRASASRRLMRGKDRRCHSAADHREAQDQRKEELFHGLSAARAVGVGVLSERDTTADHGEAQDQRKKEFLHGKPPLLIVFAAYANRLDSRKVFTTSDRPGRSTRRLACETASWVGLPERQIGLTKK